MANNVFLEDEGEVLPLVGSTIRLVSISSPTPRVQVVRVPAFPFADGERTAADTLLDVPIKLTVLMFGDSQFSLDELIEYVASFLNRARDWGLRREGSPIRLGIQRDGVANTSYRVITGISQMLQMEDLGGIDWMLLANFTMCIRVSFTLLTEPLAHSSTPDNVLDLDWLAGPESDRNLVPFDAIPGHMPTTVRLQLQNTGTEVWEQIWLAILGQAPPTNKYVGIADVTASEGEHSTTNIGTAEEGLMGTGLDGWVPTINLPIRCICRIRIPAGDPTTLRLQAVYRFGATGLIVSGDVISMPDILNEWVIIDLGTLTLPVGFLERTTQATLQGAISVEAWVTESNLDVHIDYFQALPYYSFVKLFGQVGTDHLLVYDPMSKFGSFYWPSSSVQVYVVNDLGHLMNPCQRYGRIAALGPTTEPFLWAEVFLAGGVHDIASEGHVFADALPTYSLGLRGNA